MNNAIDDLILRFTGNDDLRPVMQSPCLSEDFVLATDAHIGIKVPLSYTSKEYVSIERFPDLSGVINSAKPCDPINIKAESLVKTISLIPMVDEYEICPSCSGEGIIECRCCNHDYDCDLCNGDGSTNKVIGKTLKPYDVININNSYFNPKYLKLLAMACEAHREECFSIISMGENRAMIAKIKETKIVIMPSLLNDKGDIHKLQQ